MRKLLEQVVTYSVLLLAMGTFTNLLLGQSLGRGDVSAAYNHTPIALYFIEIFVYLGCAAFAALHYRRMLLALRVSWPFLLINLMAFASTAWSVDPKTTIRRSAVLLGTTGFGIYLGGRYSPEELQKVLLKAFLILLGASLVFFVIHPSVVLDQGHSGAFRGLTEHKNPFGEFMATFVLVALTYTTNARTPLPRIGLVLMATTFLLWAHSGSAILSLIATMLIVPLMLLLRFKKMQLIPLFTIGLAATVALFVTIFRTSATILQLAGKDPTFTGRTDIWVYVWQAIMRHPWLGYGFDAFWQGLKGESLPIIAAVGWDVPHSHNGYLEALLGIGAVGLGFIGIAILRTGYDAILYVRRERAALGLWPVLFLFFYLVHSIPEAGFVKRDGFTYLLLTTISTSLAVQRRARKTNRAAEQNAASADQAEVATAVPVMAAAASR